MTDDEISKVLEYFSDRIEGPNINHLNEHDRALAYMLGCHLKREREIRKDLERKLQATYVRGVRMMQHCPNPGAISTSTAQFIIDSMAQHEGKEWARGAWFGFRMQRKIASVVADFRHKAQP